MEKITIPNIDSDQASLNGLLIEVAEAVNKIIDKLDAQPNNPSSHDNQKH